MSDSDAYEGAFDPLDRIEDLQGFMDSFKEQPREGGYSLDNPPIWLVENQEHGAQAGQADDQPEEMLQGAIRLLNYASLQMATDGELCTDPDCIVEEITGRPHIHPVEGRLSVTLNSKSWQTLVGLLFGVAGLIQNMGPLALAQLNLAGHLPRCWTEAATLPEEEEVPYPQMLEECQAFFEAVVGLAAAIRAGVCQGPGVKLS